MFSERRGVDDVLKLILYLATALLCPTTVEKLLELFIYWNS